MPAVDPANDSSRPAAADPVREPIFALRARLAAKAAPEVLGSDPEFFADLAEALDAQRADVARRLAEALRKPGGAGQQSLDRDEEVRRLTAQGRRLARLGVHVVLGRMTPADGEAEVHIGRLSLTGEDGRRLLLDWRSPQAAPFFAATLADPQGLRERRRYRWTGGRVTDYWDELLVPTEGERGVSVALDDQSAFLAVLAEARSPRMRDVLGTIEADQDAAIRDTSRGCLVLEGGPGTGKTVVALHRAAYLLYADARLQSGSGGILFVGPHQAYLDYVSDVLPGLGEEGVRMATLDDLVPELAGAPAEVDPEVARLKGSDALVRAVERAVRYHEMPPAEEVVIEGEWVDLVVEEDDWLQAFAAVEPGTPHNEVRPIVHAELVAQLVRRVGGDAPEEELAAELRAHPDLKRAVAAAWPMLDARGVLADLWTVPAYLRRCAPGLTVAEVAALQREDGRAWTREDLPLLDAALARIGAADAESVERRRDAVERLARERLDRVVDDLIAADDDHEGLVTMLRVEDAQRSLLDEAELPALEHDALAGPFAHVIVDEAQELNDAEWRMLLRRVPTRSLTVVGDRAQARQGFAASWEDRLGRLGVRDVRRRTLTVNYRTPEEIMAEAAPVIRAVLPDAAVPTSVRSSGIPVRRGVRSELAMILSCWEQEHPDGTACVIGAAGLVSTPRVRSLSAAASKGLEFDLVVIVGSGEWGDSVTAGVDLYVAMTRATRELVLLDWDRLT